MQARITEIQVSMTMGDRDNLASALRVILESFDSIDDLPQEQIDTLNDLLYELGNLAGE